MRRVWAAVLSIWALLALVAVLAWTRAPMPAAQPRAMTAVIRTASGTKRVVVLAQPAHATTQTSQTSQPVAATQTSQPLVATHGTAAIAATPAGGN